MTKDWKKDRKHSAINNAGQKPASTTRQSRRQFLVKTGGVLAAGAFGGVACEAEHASQERPHAAAGKLPQPSGLHVIDGEVPARRRIQ